MIYFICVGILPICRAVYRMHVWCPQRPEESVASPGTVVTDGCELPRGCQQLTPGPLVFQCCELLSKLGSSYF